MDVRVLSVHWGTGILLKDVVTVLKHDWMCGWVNGLHRIGKDFVFGCFECHCMLSYR